MRKFIILATLATSLNAFPALNILGTQEAIKANKINENFAHINSLLSGKNPPISFRNFESGELITREGLETEFEKVRLLGITINSLNPGIIKADELNRSFTQMNFGASVYRAPVALALNMNDAAYQGTLAPQGMEDNYFSFVIKTPATKGSVSLGPNGNFIYTPGLNQYGEDSFSVTVSRGSLSMDITIPVTITGSGILAANGTRTYYDGSVASSCYDYLTTHSGGKSYTGNTGSGIYTIKTSASKPAVAVYCDMTTDGGGWTFFPNNTYGASTYVDWANFRGDKSKVLVYLNNNTGVYGYQILRQLADHASVPLQVTANGVNLLTVTFVPGVVKNTINGMIYNNNSYRFVNSDTNPNSFIIFKNDGTSDGNNLNVRVLGYDLWSTRVNISLPSYNMGWSGGGQYFGGGGVAISSNYFGYSWSLGLR